MKHSLKVALGSLLIVNVGSLALVDSAIAGGMGDMFNPSKWFGGKKDEPSYGAPAYGQPGYGAPGYGAPGYGAPAYGQPGQPGQPGQWAHLFERVTSDTQGDEWPAWSPDATYIAGGRVTHVGRAWECLLGHGPERLGTWAPGVAHTVWTNLGPA